MELNTKRILSSSHEEIIAVPLDNIETNNVFLSFTEGSSYEITEDNGLIDTLCKQEILAKEITSNAYFWDMIKTSLLRIPFPLIQE